MDDLRKKLNPNKALQIHNIILQSRECDFIEDYKEKLAFEAEIRRSGEGCFGGQHITPITERLAVSIFEQTGIKLQEDIEFQTVIDLLPDEIVDKFYMEPEPEPAVTDYAGFIAGIKKAFKGTVGIPGTESFAILLDSRVIHGLDETSVDEAFGKLHAPFSKKQLSDFKKSGYQTALTVMSEKALEKGCTPENTYIIPTGVCRPETFKLIARYVNFPGSSYYLDRQRST